VSRAYDPDFRVVMVNVEGGAAITHEYDDDGLLTRAGDLEATYTANGLPNEETLGTILTTQERNGFGELAHYTAARGATFLYNTGYTRDALGRIEELHETIAGVTRTVAYTYDPAGRLETVTVNDVLTEAYTYDANGNRTSGPQPGVTGVYDAQDRMLSYGNATYAYGVGGELATKTVGAATTTYDYDVAGNLLAVSLPDGRDIEYVVDGTNRRIGKKVDGVLVQGLVYQDRLRPAAELDGTGTVRSQFVYADGRTTPAYLVRGGQTYRVVADHVGSVRLVVDAATGAIAQRLDYDAWGRVTADTNPGFQPFGFAGGLYDPDTGLTRFGARDYDAATGRWTTKDPRGFAGGQTNLYAYVGGDPVNLGDPEGEAVPLLFYFFLGAFVGAIGGTVVLAPSMFRKLVERRNKIRWQKIKEDLAHLENRQRAFEKSLRRAPPDPCKNEGAPEPAPAAEPQPAAEAPREPLNLVFEAQEVEPPPQPAPPEPELAWTESPPPCPSPSITPPVRGTLCQ
jgi:RHS repeat-associated protein